jgi:hypothetical protein
VDSEWRKVGGEDCAQQKPQPSDEAAEVVAGGGEDGVDGIAGGIGEIRYASGDGRLALRQTAAKT